ncbi:hypothetical protein GCM10027059_27180 [Myceligenerans halotolerans]
MPEFLEIPVAGRAPLTVRPLTHDDETAARAAHASFPNWTFLFVHDGETWAKHLERLDQERRGESDLPGARCPRARP